METLNTSDKKGSWHADEDRDPAAGEEGDHRGQQLQRRLTGDPGCGHRGPAARSTRASTNWSGGPAHWSWPRPGCCGCAWPGGAGRAGPCGCCRPGTVSGGSSPSPARTPTNPWAVPPCSVSPASWHTGPRFSSGSTAPGTSCCASTRTAPASHTAGSRRSRPRPWRSVTGTSTGRSSPASPSRRPPRAPDALRCRSRRPSYGCWTSCGPRRSSPCTASRSAVPSRCRQGKCPEPRAPSGRRQRACASPWTTARGTARTGSRTHPVSCGSRTAAP